MSDMNKAVSILLGDIIEGKENDDISNRELLGGTVSIRLFQSLRLVGLGTAIENMVGDGAKALVYRAGQDLGMGLGGELEPIAKGSLDDYVSLVQGAAKSLGIGLVVVEKVDLNSGELTLRVDECVSCAGIEGVSNPICNFEAGLVGGLIKAFVKGPVKAIETRCHACGDATCGVDVQIL